MKMINCPLNGLRNINEFVYGGEVTPMPDPNACTDREWAEYIFFHENGIGVVTEWWLHSPSSYWFIAERHTASDEIMKTYDARERFNQRIEFSHADITTKSATESATDSPIESPIKSKAKTEADK